MFMFECVFYFSVIIYKTPTKDVELLQGNTAK
jgi:hypothetical protein